MKNHNQLDSVAKLFPAVTSKSNSSVFRLSVVLKEEVNPHTLQLAVNMIYERYSLYFLRLRRGFFWNYFDTNFVHFEVEEEHQSPCISILSHENRGYIIKVLYYKNRISVEAYHAITDGSGIIEFIKSLLYYYLSITHGALDHQGKVLLFNETEKNDEDSFKKYFNNIKSHEGKRRKATKKTKNSPNSFRIEGKKFKHRGHSVVTGVLPLSEFKNYCKTNNCSITAFIITNLIFAIYNEKQKGTNSQKPIVIAVPVNLRKLFPSSTLKNFFNVVNVGYTMTEEVDFKTLLQSITSQLQLTNDSDFLEEASKKRLKLSKNPVSRHTPLVVKNVVVPIGFKFMGELKKTMTISNIGSYNFPDEMKPYIEQTEVFLYPTAKSPINCSACSFEDNLSISFTRSISDASIIREFFTSLVKATGIDINMYSNQWGDKYE